MYEYNDYYISKAFDNNLETLFWSHGAPSKGNWIMLTFSSNVKLNKLTINCPDDDDKIKSNYVLEVSTDGETWKEVSAIEEKAINELVLSENSDCESIKSARIYVKEGPNNSYWLKINEIIPEYEAATEPEQTYNYYLIGSFNNWDKSTAYPMAGDTKTLSLSAGTYTFKVITPAIISGEDSKWDTALGYDKIDPECSSEGVESDGSNVKVTLAKDGEVTVKALAGYLCISGNFVSAVISQWSVVGDKALTGANWNPAETANDMVQNAETGVWTLEKEGVTLTAGDYEYKLVANNSWAAGEFPSGENNNKKLTITKNGVYNVTFTWNAVTQSLSASAVGITAFTVDISDRAKIMDESFTPSVLQKGTTKVSPGEFMILRNSDNYDIFSVKKGDEMIPATSGYYMVTLAEGETVDIVCTWVGDATITLSDKDAIASITAAGQEVTVNSTEVKVPMGTKVVITLNEGCTSDDKLIFYAENDSYSITTTAPELFTLTVDNVSKVTMYNENYEECTPVNGDQKVSPGKYQIKSVTGYMINKVTLNGETLVGDNGVYDVTAAKNDKIVVTAEYEAEDYNITFNDVAAIKSVTTAYNGEQLAIGEMEGIYFTASYSGYKITVELNEGYTTESALEFYLTQNVQIVTKVAGATAIEKATAPAKAKVVKTIENGKVVIIRDGERYDITGRKI